MISEAAWFLCEVLLLEDALMYVYMGAKVNRLLLPGSSGCSLRILERGISAVSGLWRGEQHSSYIINTKAIS